MITRLHDYITFMTRGPCNQARNHEPLCQNLHGVIYSPAIGFEAIIDSKGFNPHLQVVSIGVIVFEVRVLTPSYTIQTSYGQTI
jgi:hypothetical protein